MKTKYLLMTMALPAVFAACSNDDFVEQSTNAVANDGRPVVGDVVLHTTFPKVPATRLDWGITDGVVKASLEPGIDQIGAVQIDEYRGEEFPQYKLEDDINTNFNYWLETNDNDEYVWKGATYLSEGNYLFYLNYDKGMLARSTMYDVVDPVQNAFDEKGKYDKFNALNDQFYIGYKFLEAGQGKEMVNDLGIRLTPIHTRVGVKAVYRGAGEVKITKIAIRKADNNDPLETFAQSFVNGAIDYAAMTMKVNIKPATTDRIHGFLDRACYDNGIYKLKKNKDGVNISEETPDDYDALMNSLVYPNLDKENLTYQFEVNFPDCAEATLSNDESVTGYILMPTWNFSRSDNPEDPDAWSDVANMVLAIYTNKGMFEVPMIAHQLDYSPVQGSSVRVEGDLNPMNAQRIAYYTVEFDEMAANNKPHTFTVNNTKDLLTQLKLFENELSTQTLSLYAASSDVVMDQDVYDFLVKKPNIRLELKSGQMVVDVKALKDGKSPLDLIYLDREQYMGKKFYDEIWGQDHVLDMDVPAPTIVVKGDYATSGLNYVGDGSETLGALLQGLFNEEYAPDNGIMKYNNIALPLIKVADGGKLTVNASVGARIEVEEGAQLVISSTENKNIGVLSIVNNGTTDINSKFATFDVFNAAVAELNINANSKFSLYNDRDIKLDNQCCLDDKEAFSWTWGKVNVKTGVEAYLYGLEYKWQNDVLYGNWGIINNDGEIKCGRRGNNANFEWNDANFCINHGRIINNGEITDLWNDGYVDNNGILSLAESTKWSYVDVTEAEATEVGAGRDNKKLGVVAFQAAEKNTELELGEIVNKLIVSSEVCLKDENKTVETIVLKDNANLKGVFSYNNLNVYAWEGASKLNGVTFAGKLTVLPEADVTVVEDSKLTDIVVRKDGELTIAAKKTMTYEGEFKNFGTVHVQAEGIAKAGVDATYQSIGGVWDGNNEPRPSVSYNTFYNALVDAVKTYINKNTAAAAPTSVDVLDNVANLKWMANSAKVDLNDEFTKAVKEITTNTEALLTELAAISYTKFDVKLYDTQKDAYEAFKEQIIAGTGFGEIKASVRVAANALTDDQIANLLDNVQPCRYIWAENSCPLYDVMTVMQKGNGQWAGIFGEALDSFNTLETVKDFLVKAGAYAGNSAFGLEARALYQKYSGSYQTWNYSDDQVEAINTELSK